MIERYNVTMDGEEYSDKLGRFVEFEDHIKEVESIRASGKSLSAKEIADAYRKHQRVLIATMTMQCCRTGPSPRPIIQNDQVLLRKLLEELGFSETEIDECWRGGC